ncbi:5-oxoprolinase subunit PxpA [Bacillus sp. PS06]|uniref:5-oxoprolinase subunit PxpA n=1 Tax=Bacillus sp. PS06 TaxID=2764176 RepID=UPI00178538C2|nr:5-oxoprolinase subunit PxpA [Bacillus sp. PS06]MBD8071364.1 LamB/YcsF family protein [Bacillus sp. PS06]
MNKVDLNCDLGESFGVYQLGRDEDILDVVTSANIACGFHAGDPTTIRKTVQLALEKNVAIGAHPGLPDKVGFGRRNMDITPQEAFDMVVYQIGAVQAFVQAEGSKLQHVKPHGALYNMAARNQALAEAIAEAIYKVNPELILLGLSGSELVKAGDKLGLHVASEVFADRTYQIDGSLTPRSQENALIIDEEQAVRQVIQMAKEGSVLSVQGQLVPIKADSICIHGDGEHALQFAGKIKAELMKEQISINNLANL